MHPNTVRKIALRALAVAALIVAGAVFHSRILAQTVITITPIPQPVTDTGIPFAPAGASAVSRPSAADAWGGPRTGSEPTLSDRVVDYRIEATLDPVKHSVTGKQSLTWRNRSKVDVRSVYLHLYMNAFEHAGSTFFTEQRRTGRAFRSGLGLADNERGYIAMNSVAQGGVKVPWSFVHPDNGPETDHTVVRLDLPAEVAPGASTTIDIAFLTQLPRVIARTGYFGSFHMVGQWYPKIGVLELPGERGATAPRWNVHEFHLDSEFYGDFGHFDVKLTVPKGYTVGATGELQGAPVERNGAVTHHYAQGDVHDFAWTADSRSAAPLRDTWTGPGSPTVQLTVLYPPDRAASAAPALKAAKESLSYFSATLGPYPYKTLTVVVPPFNADEAGAMEYPTLFTVSGFETVKPRTAAASELDFVTIHEFGHNYFQGILASNEIEEPMLDEGVNQYWNQRMLRDRSQDLYLGTPFLKAIGFAPAFRGFDLERMGAEREDPADPLGENAWVRLQGLGPAYERSATFLRDLEQRIGTEATARAFREYYRRWKFRHPSLADLRETIADVSGQRAVVEAMFAQQVYATSKVDDRVALLSSLEVHPPRIAGETIDAYDDRIEDLRGAWEKANPKARPGSGPFSWLTTVTVRRRGAVVPQTVTVRFSGGDTHSTLWNDDAKWRTFTFVRPTQAMSVELDPQRQHYLDTNKLDDGRTLEPDGRASRRWTGEIAAIVNLLLSLIATV